MTPREGAKTNQPSPPPKKNTFCAERGTTAAAMAGAVVLPNGQLESIHEARLLCRKYLRGHDVPNKLKANQPPPPPTGIPNTAVPVAFIVPVADLVP